GFGLSIFFFLQAFGLAFAAFRKARERRTATHTDRSAPTDNASQALLGGVPALAEGAIDQPIALGAAAEQPTLAPATHALEMPDDQPLVRRPHNPLTGASGWPTDAQPS